MFSQPMTSGEVTEALQGASVGSAGSG